MRKTTLPAVAASMLGLLMGNATASEAYVTSGRWGKPTAVYYVNPKNNDVSEAAAVEAVRAAADAWSLQSRASFAFVFGGTTTTTAVGLDDKSTFLFRNEDAGNTLGVTYYWSTNGYFIESDIILYDGGVRFFTGSSGCSSGFYVEDVGTHEFGHALGLGHSSVGDATMVSGQGACTTWKRTLAEDDISGVEYLYPPSTTTSTPPRAPTGVKVIAGILDSLGPAGPITSGLGGGLLNDAAPAELAVPTRVPVDLRTRRMS